MKINNKVNTMNQLDQNYNTMKTKEQRRSETVILVIITSLVIIIGFLLTVDRMKETVKNYDTKCRIECAKRKLQHIGLSIESTVGWVCNFFCECEGTRFMICD
jgi:hypothetical protein